MDLQELARSIAKQHGLDPALVCAVIEQESNWNPWAIRMEPAFYAKYTKPMSLSDTEEYTRAISWGLMQLMGECARELGFKEKFLSYLCVPEAGIEWGCQWLERKLKAAGGDVRKALLLWNGGANKAYPAEVLARRAKYVAVA
jgi:soluble lytic murein transglycosylase-like protein